MPTVLVINKTTNHGMLLYFDAFQRAIPFQTRDHKPTTDIAKKIQFGRASKH